MFYVRTELLRATTLLGNPLETYDSWTHKLFLLTPRDTNTVEGQGLFVQTTAIITIHTLVLLCYAKIFYTTSEGYGYLRCVNDNASRNFTIKQGSVSDSEAFSRVFLPHYTKSFFLQDQTKTGDVCWWDTESVFWNYWMIKSSTILNYHKLVVILHVIQIN